MKMKRTLKDVEQKMKLSDFDVTGKKGHAAGGIAGQLHLNRPGYQQGFKVYPKIDLAQGEQGLGEGFSLGTSDLTYGGTGVYQGENVFAGVEGEKIKNKIDFMKDNESLFKDTTDDDRLNFIFGIGEIEGDKTQIKTDLENILLTFKKKLEKKKKPIFKKAAGGLAHVLGV